MSDKPDKQRQQEISRQMAEALGETDQAAVATLGRLVYVLGEERVQALLDETLAIEADGGLLTADGQRPRTRGGIFFKLAKDLVESRERWRIFNPPKPKPKPKLLPPEWPELLPLAERALTQFTPGEASKVKLTLIGRPGKIIEKGATVLTTMQSGKAPSLPKGLPSLPPKPTTYVVFIARKQWLKVREALAADPTDRLIVEGYPVFDPRIGGGTMCLYAQMVTTNRPAAGQIRAVGGMKRDA